MSLQKFIDAQTTGKAGATWRQAIDQLRRTGGKGSLHYAWYIFPQLAGVKLMATGNDPTAISRYYAINNLEQAVAYLRNADLRNHLMIFATEMARIAPLRSIGGILGIGDANKFKSSMTLFLIAAIAEKDDNATSNFTRALMRFGAPRLYDNLDPVTLTILREQNSPLLAQVPRGVFSIIESDEDGAAAHASDSGGGGDGGDAISALTDPIVEMGFSTSEAFKALAEAPRTNQREHIAAAIEWLLAQQASGSDESGSAAAAAAPPPAPPVSPDRGTRRRPIGHLPRPSGIWSSRRPRLPKNRSRKPAKKWPKVQTGQGGQGRRTRRRRKRRTRKRRRRRRRKRKTYRRNK